jgi:hypothetical protein
MAVAWSRPIAVGSLVSSATVSTMASSAAVVVVGHVVAAALVR